MRKIALVHDWLSVYAGAEQVLGRLLRLYPEADLFALVDGLRAPDRGFLGSRPVHTTFIQSLPGARKHYRNYLPLMPLAIEQLDLSEYDLVISSSHAVAKGVLTGPDQLHISYVHSPMRYAWDLQHQYLREAGLTRGWKGWVARAMLHYLRLWDYRSAQGVDSLVANSAFIARRIQKVYRRSSTVIYPPVSIDDFSLCETKQDFYVTASRMVPYKRVDLIVEAFTAMPEKRLVVIGDGPDFNKIRAKAGANVTFLGFAQTDVLRDHLQRARAFVFAAEEDFGISPVEAQACGTPVIAYGKGGALETIVPLEDPIGPGLSPPATGIFFYEQTVPAIVSAVQRFEEVAGLISPVACRENALRFSPERFRDEFTRFVEEEWAKFCVESGRRRNR